jgi:isoquinoline 1-oxidoreductase beta subunit
MSTSKMHLENVSRRRFMKTTGIISGGLVLGTILPSVAPLWAAEAGDNELNLFVSIRPDGQVDIICHRSEMGQGIRTGIPQVIAEELCADWDKVNVVQGLADEAYGSQNTDGSRSIRRNYQRMREMGASARAMLEQAAAKQWSVDVSQVYAEDSMIKMQGSSKQLGFGELVADAMTMTPPTADKLTFKSPKDFKLIGKPIASVDINKVVTGTTEFGQDVQLPGMLYASIERTPVVGGTVDSFDASAASSVNGVVKVFNMPARPLPALFNPKAGVAVIATNTWSALQGRQRLNVQWKEGEHAQHNSDSYLDDLKSKIVTKGKVIRSSGDAYVMAGRAAEKISATYTMPYLVHAPMEPPAATAVFKDGECEVWACTQTPQSAQQNVAGALGIDKEKVKVHVTLLGGAFGRKSKPDYVVEAALLAKETGKPIKVVWSREDDIQHGYYHAVSAQHFEAGLNSNNVVQSWVQRTAFPSISWTFDSNVDEPQAGEQALGFGDLPFDVGALSMETHKAPGHIRIGWIRSVSNIHHGFAVGSFVDEVAVKAGKKPHEMWLDLLGNDRIVDPTEQGFEYGNYGESKDIFPIETRRLKNVLNLVIEKSGADKATPNGEGWGISVHRSFVSYVAVATKVKVADGKVSILEMHSAIDAGTVVNPDRVRAQQEGSMIFGLSISLLGEISVKDGAVQQSNFHDFQVLRMPQCPKIETYIVQSDAPPGGVGEPGVPPVAASVANAIYHATGQRIRDLPISKHMKV